MTKLILLEAMKAFCEERTRDLLLPVQATERDEEPPEDRAPAVYVPRLPELRAYAKKAPFITCGIITGKDSAARDRLRATAVVRSVFCVYHENEMEGELALLNLMERIRIGLLEQVVIGKQFKLDLESGIESLVYPGNPNQATNSPFYLGEMITTWQLPTIERKVPYGKEGYGNIHRYGAGRGPDCPEGGRHYIPPEEGE